MTHPNLRQNCRGWVALWVVGVTVAKTALATWLLLAAWLLSKGKVNTLFY